MQQEGRVAGGWAAGPALSSSGQSPIERAVSHVIRRQECCHIDERPAVRMKGFPVADSACQLPLRHSRNTALHSPVAYLSPSQRLLPVG